MKSWILDSRRSVIAIKFLLGLLLPMFLFFLEGKLPISASFSTTTLHYVTYWPMYIFPAIISASLIFSQSRKTKLTTSKTIIHIFIGLLFFILIYILLFVIYFILLTVFGLAMVQQAERNSKIF